MDQIAKFVLNNGGGGGGKSPSNRHIRAEQWGCQLGAGQIAKFVLNNGGLKGSD